MAKRVLIVDDTLFMRIKLRGLLEKWGYEVVGEGVNGLEAVAKFTELRPDFVLMDITMPEMDGLAALKEIKKIDSKAVVVMVSAMGQERSVKEAIVSGARNFVIKPFQDDKIQDVLARL
ncbi:MAG: two-component system response regulator [Firmicutes bacterium]|nr:two-component system response regulator [Bacillota bacterium]